MAIDDLLRAGRIRRERISPAEVREALTLADRDLRVARKLIGEELDWGFTVAYNAVLQAGRAFMSAKGYRPASAEGHRRGRYTKGAKLYASRRSATQRDRVTPCLRATLSQRFS